MATVRTGFVTLLIVAAAIGSAAAQDDAREPRRLALVIGNWDYAHLGKLPSAKSDADSMTVKLRELGFHVDTTTMTSAARFEDSTLVTFARRIQEGDIVVVYFSGHGFAYGNATYFAPLALPLNVPESWMPDSAVAIANVGEFLSKVPPALIVIITDACREISGFVVRDTDNVNVAHAGIVDDPQFGDGNGIIAYAASKGKVAIGRSEANRLSLFTKSLYANIDAEGSSFDHLYYIVKTDVRIASDSAQLPTMLNWADSELYLKPDETIRAVEKKNWDRARSSNDKANVARYARLFATGPYAWAARNWVGTQTPPLDSIKRTSISATAVERAWDSTASAIVVSRTAIGIGFDRLVDEHAAFAVTALSDDDIGAGRRSALLPKNNKESVDAAVARAHETVIAMKELIAREAPTATSAAREHLQPGTRLSVVDVTENSKGETWLTARTSAAAPVFYVKATASPRMAEPVRLGKALASFVVPTDSLGMHGQIDESELRRQLGVLQRQQKDIRWVSLATRATADPLGDDIHKVMLLNAEAVIKSMGISGRRITAVSAASDLPMEGVRVRVIGWDP